MREAGEREIEKRERREVGDFSCLARREIEKRERINGGLHTFFVSFQN